MHAKALCIGARELDEEMKNRRRRQGGSSVAAAVCHGGRNISKLAFVFFTLHIPDMFL